MFKKKPLVHENPNIEIINKNLWAVRFSLIPMIPQISYKPDPEDKLETLPGQLSPDGIMLLNKDHRLYERIRKTTLIAMGLNDRVLKKEIAEFSKIPAKNPGHVIYLYCLRAEVERRKLKKGGAA